MIRFFDILSFLAETAYGCIFFVVIFTFLPLRRNRLVQVLAFIACITVAVTIIYPNDLGNLLGALIGFIAYIIVFHRGRWMEKLTAVLCFYPAFIAVNYLMMNIGESLFFQVSGAASIPNEEWTQTQYLISTAIYSVSQVCRLLFWIISWRILRKHLRRITSDLTMKMWMVVDALMTAPFVAIFTIIYYVPENTIIAYPICFASVFSSFGCVYLTSYICSSVQTAYRAQELEMRQAYYKDKISAEERVRSIYHDLKNHLLVLQAQTGNEQELQLSVQGLQNQIRDYENYYHTGKEFLDIIIRDKARMAGEKQIDLGAVISFEDSSFIEPLDISTIFGNALDNAIEASEKLPEEQRLITVKANRVQDMLAVIVENNTEPDCDITVKTSKQDAFVHGFGLSNIRNAVEKYGGQCSTKAEGGMYRMKIVIPIP